MTGFAVIWTRRDFVSEEMDGGTLKTQISFDICLSNFNFYMQGHLLVWVFYHCICLEN